MRIELSGLGKRFNRDWIFQNLSYTFLPGKRYAVTGPNGSGKSTFLQIIAGTATFQRGRLTYTEDEGQSIPQEKAYRLVSLAAPYLELIEEMTLKEFVAFHGKMKGWEGDIHSKISQSGLDKAIHKQIRYFSSGMKQRVKLLQAFHSEVQLILLDEPTSNLDEDGINFYFQELRESSPEKTLIVASNDKNEYDFCDEVINILTYR